MKDEKDSSEACADSSSFILHPSSFILCFKIGWFR
jgi:hypothetical protein